MYGHQVIDALKGIDQECAPDQVYVNIAKKVRGDILQAQHFHLGDAEDIYKFVSDSMKGTRPFLSPEMSEGVRLPYETCWFDFRISRDEELLEDQYRSTKRGILTNEVAPDLFMMFLVNYVDQVKRWILTDRAYMVSIGKVLAETQAGDMMNQLAPGIAAAYGYSTEQVLSVYEQTNVHMVPAFDPRRQAPPTPQQLQQLMHEDSAEIDALNIFLLLLSCRNVTTANNRPGAALNKKRKKKGKTPLFTYKTLLLDPMKSARGEGRPPQNLWKNRIHLCRGHFKVYTEDKPLFGRITGRFWWDPHARGNKKEGVVMKDYAVKEQEVTA